MSFYCKSLLGFFFHVDDLLKWVPCNVVNKRNVTVVKNVVYDDEHADCCKLDLYFDKNKKGLLKEGKYPVFFNIHGGGWIAGDKSYRVGLCKHLADTGCFVISINYGLAPKYKLPDMLRQIFRALEWMIASKEEYSLDLDNIIVSGDSAGGHLSVATINALDNDEMREKYGLPNLSLRFKGFVSYCSALNLESNFFRLPLMRDMVLLPTGEKRLSDVSERCAFYDLVKVLDGVNERFPDTYQVTGMEDIFTRKGNLEFAEILKEKNIYHERYVSYEPLNSFHDFNLRTYMPSARICLNRVKDFIWRTYRKEEAQTAK